ncbi:DUF962 domain-containing protein [Acinetobacter qingfengensis]|uniref:Uncharacterized protein n=1 Tax=Acinetobacter qingfengensis TaxID=1262585 RepID=A0A1E7R2R0_9GAMM|nr:Mpo1-like protein [Acinetobacter qingfengensis]KAA8733868.1 DUF962 domain-containing protein [Acinetobacter qingfengensis]OEY93619.1 hypothetical protein BJI46_04035 [Acinetobacter qingfengensis]
MDKLAQNLSQYAAYHLSRKNIMTHIIGIPLIVASIILLLARVQFILLGWDISLAHLMIALSCLFYLRLDIVLGSVLLMVFVLFLLMLSPIAQMPTLIWLSSVLGLFIIGWIFQFIGHYFEKMKPAFFDDIKGLLIGPLFIAAELLFMLGYKPNLQQQVQYQAVQLRRQLQQKIR